MIQIGDLVKIKMSNSRNLIDKMAIIIHIDAWNADIHIIDTGEQDRYAISRLGSI